MEYEDFINKPKGVSALIRILANTPNQEILIDLRNDEYGNKTIWSTQKNINEIHAGKYNVFINNVTANQVVEFNEGGVYTVLISKSSDGNYVRSSILNIK